jgi:hypothetical protein
VTFECGVQCRQVAPPKSRSNKDHTSHEQNYDILILCLCNKDPMDSELFDGMCESILYKSTEGYMSFVITGVRHVSWYHVCGFHLLSYLRLAPIDSI